MQAPCWTLEQIDWHRFQPDRVDARTLAAVKTAALVEFNADDYVGYLDRVFADDAVTRSELARWGAEERQHGEALARWARLADPRFDFDAAIARFRSGYRIHPDAVASVRGSRAGELIARCVVECGTSSFYSSLRDGAGEPVLRQIATLVARDEFHHYRLFLQAYHRYAETDRIGLLGRLRIAVGRVNEADDDELAYAYWSANLADLGQPYDRAACFRAQQLAALGNFRREHVRRAVHMIARAVGLSPSGLPARAATAVAWRLSRRRGAPAPLNRPPPDPSPCP
jgi:hypothetical protein